MTRFSIAAAPGKTHPCGRDRARTDDLHEVLELRCLGPQRALWDRKEIQEVPGPGGEFDHFAGVHEVLAARGGTAHVR
jgi:hypothetical protein